MFDAPPDNIVSLGPKYYKLCNILNENDGWASLLEVVPYGDNNELERLGRAAEKGGTQGPAEVILWRLATRGTTIPEIKRWLKEIHLEKALVALEEDNEYQQSLKIVLQPCHSTKATVNQEVVLTCQAVAYPFQVHCQWFRKEDELKGETFPTLRISSAQLHHSGLYVCRVHTISEDGAVDCLFSDISEVVVVEHSAISSPLVPRTRVNQHVGTWPYNANIIASQESQMYLSRDSNETSELSGASENNMEIVDDLNIYLHPVSPGDINEGTDSLTLKCKGRSSFFSVNYQWFCNGRPMQGETANVLKLTDLFRDTHKGKYYHCEVSTEEDRLHSRSASLNIKACEDTQYYAKAKHALLFANNLYDDLDDLKTPPNDVATLARQLRSEDFQVLVFKNLNLTEMKDAVKLFCQVLCKDAYALIYYAGHGFEQFGQSYMQPVDCDISCDVSQCLCVEEVLERLQEKELAVTIALLDMCRKLPPQHNEGVRLKPGRICQPKLKNLVYGYATTFLYPAFESNHSPNGFFMKYLTKHIRKKEPILTVLWNVRRDFENDNEIHDRQFPWIESNLGVHRMLTDPVDGDPPDLITSDVKWPHWYAPPFPNLSVSLEDVSFILKFHPHQDQICNATDLYIYLNCNHREIQSVARKLDVELIPDLYCPNHPLVSVTPFITVKYLNATAENPCFCIIEIPDLQKIKEDFTATLIITDCSTENVIVYEQLPFKQPVVSKLIGISDFCEELHQRGNSGHELINSVLSCKCLLQNVPNKFPPVGGDLLSFESDNS